MANYLLIESRDPFEARDVSYFYSLAADLAAQGDKVTLFLVQNGALASRKDAKGNPLGTVLKGKVEVLVDSFSLKERGIQDGLQIGPFPGAEDGDRRTRAAANSGPGRHADAAS